HAPTATSAEVLPRRLAERRLERGDERAHAGVAGVERHRGHRIAARELLEGATEPELLAPRPEAHSGLGAKQALDRALARAAPTRDLACRPGGARATLHLVGDSPRPGIAREWQVQRARRERPQLVHEDLEEACVLRDLQVE